MINPITQFNQNNNTKYKDPLNSNIAVLMSYSNEIGTTISEIAPKVGTALWVPTFLYLGADIYDKYKNDKDNYNPSTKRALKRTIFQAITCLAALPTVIYTGQCLVSPLGKLDKTGISGNVKDEIYRHTKYVIDQAHGTALKNCEQFKTIIVKTLENKINARTDEKNSSNIFENLFKKIFTNRFDILNADKKKVIKFAEQNAEQTFEIAKAIKDGNTSKIPRKIYKKYKKVLPIMKETYNDSNYAFQATRTALKEFQKSKIFKNKILKTISGLITLVIFAKPVNDCVDEHIMKKFVDKSVDQLDAHAFKKFVFKKSENTNVHI